MLKSCIKHTLIVISAFILIACSAIAPNYTNPPKPVETVDLHRYVGTWYEIARLPIYFQRHCMSDVTAHYSLNANGTININNQCKDKYGELSQAIGIASKDGLDSQLKVSFLPKGLRWLPFGKADYWVLALDDNYQYALVGTPNHRYLWILSRTPDINPATYQNLLRHAHTQGYAIDNLQRTMHSDFNKTP